MYQKKIKIKTILRNKNKSGILRLLTKYLIKQSKKVMGRVNEAKYKQYRGKENK